MTPLITKSQTDTLFTWTCRTFIAMAILLPAPDLWAGNLDDVVRAVLKVADDVPVSQVDDLAKRVKSSRAARELVESEVQAAKRVARAANRSQDLIHVIDQTAGGLDPKLLTRLKGLAQSDQELAYIMARGAKSASQGVPDIVSRAKFLERGGADTIAAIGLHGDEAAAAAARLDQYLLAGRVVAKGDVPVPTLARFGRVMSEGGTPAWAFWQKYVSPHWKLWAASGALAAYLAAPETFQDLAGNLTESGVRELTEFVGAVSAAAIRGAGKGSEKAVEKIFTATTDVYVNNTKWQYAAAGTALLVCVSLLLFRRIRAWVLRPFAWLNRHPS